MAITIGYLVILATVLVFFPLAIIAIFRAFARCIAKEVVKEMNKTNKKY